MVWGHAVREEWAILLTMAVILYTIYTGNMENPTLMAKICNANRPLVSLLVESRYLNVNELRPW